ncbi:Myb-like_DNA-binding domain-containing protein [Hexamita inflata]|uniref:Myb-like_DNA-binding domain-containing protein n=1 Tax=Hexamita inflata TaxID=28002 RepID=A0ABP1HDK6_9EUKA
MIVRIYEKWTYKERQLLKQLLKLYNSNNKFNWKAISDQMKTRTQRQCYDQYILLFKTDKSGERHKWTEAEEQLLISNFKQSPYGWKNIQQHFTQLSVRQLKNKYNQLARSQKYQLISSDSEFYADTDSDESLKHTNPIYKTSNGKLVQNMQQNQNLHEAQQLKELALFLSQHLDL